MQRAVDPIVVFIREYIDAHGYPPTQREIGQACSLTLSAVNHRIQMLAAAGRIDYLPKRARGVRLPKDSDLLPPAA